MNSSAIVQFQSLDKGTYLPYVRALKKIEKEEGFHYHHALDLSHQVMVEGTKEQRQLVQGGFDTWFPRLLGYFGPPDSAVIKDNPLYKWGIKVDSNDDIRQRWMSKIIPVVMSLGIHVDETVAKLPLLILEQILFYNNHADSLNLFFQYKHLQMAQVVRPCIRKQGHPS
jgi:ring-1,2-phenylacetyl-CoA epoxidase subunit PaaA